MSNPQVTMSGTATLRDWADKIENWNWRPGQLLGPVALRQMAANWDADLNYAAGLIADATLSAERAEAALGRLQGEVETILNTEPHADNCRVVSRECNCWQARLSKALDGDKMTNFGERAWIEPDPPEPDYQAELAAAREEIETLRAALERERSELTSACMSVSHARERSLSNEIRANNAEKALERARALAETWAAMKYNGDLTAAVYHGCADELAAALGSGGAA